MHEPSPEPAAVAALDAAAVFRPVKSAYRALDVLEAVAARPATLSELSRELGIPKSSLHGLVRTLTERGWITPTEGGSRLQLGLKALLIGTRFVDEDDLVSRASTTLDRLASLTGETVQQARLDGDQVVYLAKRDSTHSVRLISAVGGRLPAHATAVGKALLAARDDHTVRALLRPPLRRLTARTLTDPDALIADLHETRRRGYAVDREEAAEGLRCFAVVVPPRPLRHAQAPAAPVTDAVSVSVPTFRLDEDREQRLVEALLAERDRLARGG
jgi:DNA-binding IclR family transcriptional regulator